MSRHIRSRRGTCSCYATRIFKLSSMPFYLTCIRPAPHLPRPLVIRVVPPSRRASLRPKTFMHAYAHLLHLLCFIHFVSFDSFRFASLSLFIRTSRFGTARPGSAALTCTGEQVATHLTFSHRCWQHAAFILRNFIRSRICAGQLLGALLCGTALALSSRHIFCSLFFWPWLVAYLSEALSSSYVQFASHCFHALPSGQSRSPPHVLFSCYLRHRMRPHVSGVALASLPLRTCLHCDEQISVAFGYDCLQPR